MVNKIEDLKKSDESKGKISNVYHKGAADFNFEKKYDIIFGQWFLENLNDLDVLKFIIKAKESLNLNGKLFFKENMSNSNGASITEIGQKIRNRKSLIFLFELCGLKVVMMKISDKYPENYTQLYEIVLQKED